MKFTLLLALTGLTTSTATLLSNSHISQSSSLHHLLPPQLNLAADISSCPSNTTLCDDDCIPSSGICCFTGQGGFCDPGYVCFGKNSCCPEGQTCDEEAGTCKEGKELCGDYCMDEGANCCNPDDGTWCNVGDECSSKSTCASNDPDADPPAGPDDEDAPDTCFPSQELCGNNCIPKGSVCCGNAYFCPKGDLCGNSAGTCIAGGGSDEDDTTMTLTSVITLRATSTSTLTITSETPESVTPESTTETSTETETETETSTETSSETTETTEDATSEVTETTASATSTADENDGGSAGVMNGPNLLLGLLAAIPALL